jgi:hypothetical protein
MTTADIVEIRKLILDIDTAFSSNTSWRFVDKNYVFPNPANPFAHAFPEFIDCIYPAHDSTSNFVAIKIGDVNESAVPHSRPVERPVATLGWSSINSKPGGTITIPILYTGNDLLDAIQLGIHFDPAKLSLISPSKGDLPGYNADNFGLTHVDKGEIRTLWLSPINDWSAKIKPGTTLFHLTFQVLDDLSESESLVQLDDQILDNAAWRPDGTECSVVGTQAILADLNKEVVGNPSTLQVIIHPNPTTGAATFTIKAEKTMKGRIRLFGAYGNSILERNAIFEAGQQDITIPEIKNLPAGVYLWKVYGDDIQTHGHLIKQ